MQIDPHDPLGPDGRYLITWDDHAYRVATAEDWLRDLDPAYDPTDPAAPSRRRQIAERLLSQFALQQTYDRAAGRYTGPLLQIWLADDPQAPATEDPTTVLVDTRSAAGLLTDLARAALIRWLDLQPDTAGAESGATPVPNGPPWVFANPTAADPDQLGPIELWLAGPGAALGIRYELVFEGGRQRGYGRTWADLCELLLPGYRALDPAGQVARRMHYATQQAVHLQTGLLTDLAPELRAACSPAEWAVLTASRATPVEWAIWTAPVPLVLPRWPYAPYTDRPAPVSQPRTGDPPGTNIWWIEAGSDETLITSLAALGVVGLAVAAEVPV